MHSWHWIPNSEKSAKLKLDRGIIVEVKDNLYKITCNAKAVFLDKSNPKWKMIQSVNYSRKYMITKITSQKILVIAPTSQQG